MSAATGPLKVFGVDISRLPEKTQFAILSCGALICALGFAYLQERVFLVEGFTYHGFMTLLTSVTYMSCGAVERYATNDMVRKAPWVDYAKLSVFTLGGMYLTNWSLSYLNYSTRIIFKSSKVIPVMVMGTVIQGRSYGTLEYVSAGVLVLGITLFTLGDAAATPEFSPIGIFLITLGVVADAITSNFEEASFFRSRSCSQAEVIAFSSALGALWTVLMLLQSGELFEALDHAAEHPEVVTMTAAFSTMGYCSVVFVLLLIKRFGATNTEIVKSCRKVLSIVISMMAFGKPVTTMHVLGGGAFVGSIVMGVQVKAAKAKRKAAAAVELTGGARMSGSV